MAHVILRIEPPSEARIGSNYIRLLELVDKTSSISAAGRAHGIALRRAWTLLDELNRMFKTPVIAAQCEGSDGGGARVTEFGLEKVRCNRAIEATDVRMTEQDLAALEAAARAVAADAR